eukprot:4730555-Pyramimonas_sp.AAC.1
MHAGGELRAALHVKPAPADAEAHAGALPSFLRRLQHRRGRHTRPHGRVRGPAPPAGTVIRAPHAR